MSKIISEEGFRISANLNQIYNSILDYSAEIEGLPTNVFWKTISDKEYLYASYPSPKQSTSLGPKNIDTMRLFADISEQISNKKEKFNNIQEKLNIYTRQYKQLGLPCINKTAAKVLRHLDKGNHLGTNFFVEGTTCMAAYELEVGELFATGLDSTEDFDLGWCRGSQISTLDTQEELKESILMQALLKTDRSYKINKSIPYQALNNDLYEVELLVAPSMFKTLPKNEVFSCLPVFQEQEWLLQGTTIRHIVVATDNSLAPIVAPDPRWMALHKMWLAQKPERNPLKKYKDKKQGELLMQAVTKIQNKFPIDTDFILTLPNELLPIFNKWAEDHKFIPENNSLNFKW